MMNRIARRWLPPLVFLLLATAVPGLVRPAEGIGVLTGCKVCRESPVTDWQDLGVTYE
ncbi:MAG: hypothetical protein QN141_11000 [Armatimonadota bacterium]|nr:hypothetical protein [Armatimonadota bacterium]MDR7468153.1 hypothetical protein [Armatimonadota bacterium]MDR7495147.1 hypothetical protein [Armatimonadota bacterium]MDR7499281.1 hypothetical protein [Armatimonadota bacterium]MDR7547383.1 hypothetical protein [Armatimonadota bacterium]